MTDTQTKSERFEITLGKVDGYCNGKKECRCTLEIELRRKETVAPYRDIHMKECREYVELSITGNVWNRRGSDVIQAGQMVDTIRDDFKGDRHVKRLCEIWEHWHLNGMRPGCVHQIENKWGEGRIYPDKPTNTYVKHPDGSSGWNMWAWVSFDKHPEGLLSRPCDTCGYEYGSAWLAERLPVDIETEVRALITELGGVTK